MHLASSLAPICLMFMFMHISKLYNCGVSYFAYILLHFLLFSVIVLSQESDCKQKLFACRYRWSRSQLIYIQARNWNLNGANFQFYLDQMLKIRHKFCGYEWTASDRSGKQFFFCSNRIENVHSYTSPHYNYWSRPNRTNRPSLLRHNRNFFTNFLHCLLSIKIHVKIKINVISSLKWTSSYKTQGLWLLRSISCGERFMARNGILGSNIS